MSSKHYDLNCKNCGAPLRIKAGNISRTKCLFCGTENLVLLNLLDQNESPMDIESLAIQDLISERKKTKTKIDLINSEYDQKINFLQAQKASAGGDIHRLLEREKDLEAYLIENKGVVSGTILVVTIILVAVAYSGNSLWGALICMAFPAVFIISLRNREIENLKLLKVKREEKEVELAPFEEECDIQIELTKEEKTMALSGSYKQLDELNQLIQELTE